MSFETAADSFIRPRIAAQAVPAHAVVAPTANPAPPPNSTGTQTSLRGPGGTEIGQQGGVDTADGEFSFDDLIDLVNPLHHIPVVGTLYRKITGDEIKAPAQVLGGLLFGGPVGLVASAANVIVEEASGGDLGDAAYALLFGPDETGEPDLAAKDAGTPAGTPAGNSAGTPADIAVTNALSTPTDPAGPGAASGDPASNDPARAAALVAPAAGPAARPLTPAQDKAIALPVSDNADAELPPVPAGALTGKAALDAFLNDLAGVGRAAQADTQLVPPPTLSAAEAAAAAATAPTAAQQAAPAAARAVQGARQDASQDKPVRETAAVPPNLQDLGLRDRRGSTAPVPAVPQTSQATSRPTTNHAASEAGITIRPGRATAGVDPRFLVSDPPAAGPLVKSGAKEDDFSDQMMQALQKYEDMLTARRGAARS